MLSKLQHLSLREMIGLYHISLAHILVGAPKWQQLSVFFFFFFCMWLLRLGFLRKFAFAVKKRSV